MSVLFYAREVDAIDCAFPANPPCVTALEWSRLLHKLAWEETASAIDAARSFRPAGLTISLDGSQDGGLSPALIPYWGKEGARNGGKGISQGAGIVNLSLSYSQVWKRDSKTTTTHRKKNVLAATRRKPFYHQFRTNAWPVGPIGVCAHFWGQ